MAIQGVWHQYKRKPINIINPYQTKIASPHVRGELCLTRFYGLHQSNTFCLESDKEKKHSKKTFNREQNGRNISKSNRPGIYRQTDVVYYHKNKAQVINNYTTKHEKPHQLKDSRILCVQISHKLKKQVLFLNSFV